MKADGRKGYEASAYEKFTSRYKRDDIQALTQAIVEMSPEEADALAFGF